MKTVLFIILLLSVGNCFSQSTILVGRPEIAVRAYYDSLLKLKINPYYKIKQASDSSGNLILSIDFSLEDEKFYKCSGIATVFQRSGGTEYCTLQTIWGKTEFANQFLPYVKDNFRKLPENKWEKVVDAPTPYKIEAVFRIGEASTGDYFYLTYLLKKP